MGSAGIRNGARPVQRQGHASTGGWKGFVRVCFPTQHHIDADGDRGSTVALSPGDRGSVSQATAPVLAPAPGEDPYLATGKTAHACGQGGGICRRTVLHGPHGGVLPRRPRRGPPGGTRLHASVL